MNRSTTRPAAGDNSKLAVVVVGEASESDDDDADDYEVEADDDPKISEKTDHHHPVVKECRPLDEEIPTTNTRASSDWNMKANNSNDGGRGDARTTNKDANHNNNSLLHTLLKESNAEMKRNLINAVCRPYEIWQRDIAHLTRKLIGTQKMLQTSCLSPMIRTRCRDDINQLSQSFITLDSILNGGNTDAPEQDTLTGNNLKKLL